MYFHYCLFKILRKIKDIKEKRKCHGQMDGQRENSITNTVCGGLLEIMDSIKENILFKLPSFQLTRWMTYNTFWAMSDWLIGP